MAWKGNKNNQAPNELQETINRSEKLIGDNRAKEIRRDTDTQKNFTISLYDIDETILLHLEHLQLQVEDVGKQVKVPIFYGSQERWVSAQKDGYMRDKQGKIILPAIILKRTSTAPDDTLQFFNRYIDTPVMKLYSKKNQYTKFSMLIGKNIPVNEVYNLVVPSHVILTYHFIVWTAYVEQMNKLVETLQFNTRDYWGSKKGFRFRTKIDSFGHTVELQANEDRVVKTEFDLITHGYILPDTMTKLDKHQMTTKKSFTPKKIIMGVEVVSTDYDLKILDKNREKWTRPDYINLQADTVIPGPPVSVVENIVDNSYKNILSPPVVDNLVRITSVIQQITNVINNTENPFHFPPPISSTDVGGDGWVSYDSDYYYVYTSGTWKRVPITLFNTSITF